MRLPNKPNFFPRKSFLVYLVCAGNFLYILFTAFELDVWGRDTKVLLVARSEENYAYDADGNQTSQTDITGKKTEYTYDLLGRMLTVTDNGKLVQFLSSDKEVVAETNEEGEILRYVRGLGIIVSDSEEAVQEIICLANYFCRAVALSSI